MNKRISTLMTMGLLTAGALFTTANAQTTKEAADTQFNGSKYYYLANENGGTYSYIGGQSVKKGDAVIIIEAMKMEIPVVAPEAGTIASIDVAVGDAVESGAVLATLN